MLSLPRRCLPAQRQHTLIPWNARQSPRLPMRLHRFPRFRPFVVAAVAGRPSLAAVSVALVADSVVASSVASLAVAVRHQVTFRL